MADTINEQEPIAMGATVQILSTSTVDALKDPRMVSVKIAYPKDYKGPKVMEDGKVYEVSPETADIFVKAKIATIV